MNYSTNSKLLKTKFVSCILAPIITATPFCATTFASEPTQLQDLKVHNSQKSSSTLKTIAKEVAICSGAAVLIAGSILCGAEYFSTENRLLHLPSDPLTVDEWFEKLGGTNSDIADYISMRDKFDKIDSNIDDFEKSEINKDASRSCVYCRQNAGKIVTITAKRNQSLRNLFYRIFVIHNYKTRKPYAQDFGTHFGIALSKFLVDSNTTLESLSPETEAKIFYVSSKILTVTDCAVDSNGNFNLEKLPEISSLTKNPIYQARLKSVPGSNTPWQGIWFTSGYRYLSCSQVLKVWDIAIMNISNPMNSSNELRQNLDTILSRLFLKYLSNSAARDVYKLLIAIGNGDMNRFYENPNNFKAAIRDIIE
mgnify:FL=1